MAKVIGIDLGTTNSVVAVVEGGNPTVIANQEGSRVHEGRGDPRRAGGQAPGDHESREHRVLDQAVHGTALRRGAPGDQARPVQGGQGQQRRRPCRGAGQAVLAAGNLRHDSAQAEGGRRGVPGREGHASRHHRARLLQRQPAAGDQGRGARGRSRGAADHQRAHRRRARVWARQEEGRNDRRLRPRRRHLRHLDPRDRRRRLRSQGDQRRYPPGWR